MVKTKYRHIVVKVISECNTAPASTSWQPSIYYLLMNRIATLYGDYGVASVMRDLHVKSVNPHAKIYCITVMKGAQEMVGSAIAYFGNSYTRIKECHLQTLHSSGTVRSCQKFLKRYYRSELTTLLSACKTHGQRESVQASIKNSLKLFKNRRMKTTVGENSDDEAMETAAEIQKDDDKRAEN